MKRILPGLAAAVFFVLAPPPLAPDTATDLPAATDGPGMERLGEIDFPTSAGPEAQAHFLRGVLWLHSFEYRDAREAFRAAQEAEPRFALAYWGEAMTYNHPIWLEENLAAGREALSRLAPNAKKRARKAPTEREKAYLGSVEILFGEGTKKERDEAYAAALAELAERFPDDLEAKSFHALALLGTCHEGRDIPTYMRAAAIAEEVFTANPRHPGATHYLIHAYDDPVHAPLGLRAARVYAEIAPAAEHALHMPSHVFLALGMWEENVASNVDSWEAGERRVEREGLDSDRRNYHALYWLHYGFLQLRRYDEARELLGIIHRDASASGSVRSRSHYALMRAAHLVATESDDGIPEPPDLDGLTPKTMAAELFSRGFAAVRGGNIAGAREARAELGARLLEMMAPNQQDPAHCEMMGGAVTAGYSRAKPPSTTEAEAMRLALYGLVEFAAGNIETGLGFVEQAAAAEDELPFGFGPPAPVKPVRELYGELLLDLGRPAAAAEQFERALKRAPNRTRAVLGLARAHEGMKLASHEESQPGR